MTTNQSTYAAILAMDGPPPRRIDRVRARMSANKTFRTLQSTRAFRSQEQPVNHGLHAMADTRDSGPRSLHPGDVLYWVAFLGGACLLLLCATT